MSDTIKIFERNIFSELTNLIVSLSTMNDKEFDSCCNEILESNLNLDLDLDLADELLDIHKVLDIELIRHIKISIVVSWILKNDRVFLALLDFFLTKYLEQREEIVEVISILSINIWKPYFDKVGLPSIPVWRYSKKFICILEEYVNSVFDEIKVTSYNSEQYRVLLVFSWVAANTLSGSHLKQIENYCLALINNFHLNQADYKIKIVFTYENTIENSFITHHQSTEKSRLIITDHIQSSIGKNNSRVEICHFYKSRYNSTDDWVLDICQSIKDFSPTVVLKWYGALTTSLFSKVLYNNYPVIGLLFNIQNGVDKCADILLRHGKFDAEILKKDNRWRKHNPPVIAIPKRLEYQPDDFDFNVNKKIMVSVLGGDRVTKAINDLNKEAIRSLTDLIDESEEWIWVLIGVLNGNNLPRELKRLVKENKIYTLSRLDDLRAFYNYCELFVHLPKMYGGGLGAVMAIEEDVPVVAFEGTDPCAYLTPQYVALNWTEFITMIANCMNDDKYRHRVTDDQKLWMYNTNSLESAGRELINFIHEAIELSARRLIS